MNNIESFKTNVIDSILNTAMNNGALNITDENYELLFDEVQEAVFGGDVIEFSGNQEKQINSVADEILGQLMQDSQWQQDWFGGFGFGFNKGAKNFFNFSKFGRRADNNVNDAERLSQMWQQNRGTSTRRSSNDTSRTTRTTVQDNSKTEEKSVINNEGLDKIRTLKEESATVITTDVDVQQEITQPVIEQPTVDLLEGKTPEEKKTILDEQVQSQRNNITSIQNGSNEVVQGAEQQMQTAENAMNAAIDRDANINDEVKAQIKESESAITAKSGEVSAKEAEIAQTDASITQTQGTIASLQSALSSLASPSGKEEDKEKDAKLAARRSELQSQIAAKQAELAQLEAQKQQQEAEKAQLEGEKGQLETQKDQIMAEELKDASPSTKAAIQAYENSRANVETVKSNELQKAQDTLNQTMEKLSEVEAEIEQQKNSKANTNFDINGLIDAFEQGQTGDCWLLSSLESLSNSEEGRKLLQDAIQINDDGTYTVKFDGADWAINITDADLRAARNSGQYSSGDDDVLLMEVAMQNYLTQVRNGEVQTNSADLNATAQEGGVNPLNSGRSTNLTELLTGKTNWSIGDGSSIDALFNQLENNQDSTFATLSFGAGGSGALNTLNSGTVVTGASADLGHLWSVKSVSGNNITLVNPWNSEQEIVTTKDELQRSNIQYTYQSLAA